MKFKSNSQRKAVMMKLSNKSYSQLANSGIRLRKTGDVDGDGVQNSKDCKPFDPKKQGWLHDQQIKHLKKKEAKLENIRKAEMKKLIVLRADMKQRAGVSNKQLAVKKAKMRQKQLIIDEMNKERKTINKLESQNQKMKTEIEKYSFKGKAKRFGKKVWEREKQGGQIAGRGLLAGSRVLLKGTKKVLDNFEWG